MADTPDITICPDVSAGRDDALSPFYSLNYHFGMLLGVDDFATEQQYHHGKMRLHNAWLHRAGVVWGFDVRLDVSRGEIRVLPGLALDGSGHELHLDGEACVNVVEWYLKHKDDPGFVAVSTDKGVTFDARVEIRFKSCLTRQVPALLEPCDGGSAGTAYSRLFETVDIQLLSGKAKPAPLPYHRLRVLFDLEAAVLPADQPTVDVRTAVRALGEEQQPAAYLRALRQLAALDEIDLQPARSSDEEVRLLFPAPGDSPVVLADVSGIRLKRSGDHGSLKLAGGDVDVTVRPSHIATATIQELLCGPLFTRAGSPAAGTKPVYAAAKSTGPRALPATVQITAGEISFQLDKDLHAGSVHADAFSVTVFTPATGWARHAFAATSYIHPPRVKLQMKNPLALGVLVRVIAKGTGAEPLLGTDLVPLAGAADGLEPPAHDGRDFVFMQVRS